MLIYIYIHSRGQIVKKMTIDVDEWIKLEEYYQAALKEYGDEDFCFDVMCC